MLFTKECDYAIRIMRALSDGELVSVSNICAAEQLPSAMTYKITRKLGKTGSFKKLPRHKWRNICTETGHYLRFTLYDICAAVDPDILLFRVYERRLSLFYEQSAKTMSGTSGILPPAIHAFAGDASEIFI